MTSVVPSGNTYSKCARHECRQYRQNRVLPSNLHLPPPESSLEMIATYHSRQKFHHAPQPFFICSMTLHIVTGTLRHPTFMNLMDQAVDPASPLNWCWFPLRLNELHAKSTVCRLYEIQKSSPRPFVSLTQAAKKSQFLFLLFLVSWFFTFVLPFSGPLREMIWMLPAIERGLLHMSSLVYVPLTFLYILALFAAWRASIKVLVSPSYSSCPSW